MNHLDTDQIGKIAYEEWETLVDKLENEFGENTQFYDINGWLIAILDDNEYAEIYDADHDCIARFYAAQWKPASVQVETWLIENN